MFVLFICFVVAITIVVFIVVLMGRFGIFVAVSALFRYKSRCFFRTEISTTSHPIAQQQCEQQGGNLASFRSNIEDAMVRARTQNRDFWIGLSDQEEEGKFGWNDGNALGFTKWSPGQPDNHRGGEDCVHMTFGHHKRWNDRPCTGTYEIPGLCTKLCGPETG